MKKLVAEPIDGRKVAGLEKKLDGLTHKIGRLIDLLTEADEKSMDAYRRAIAQAENERNALIYELDELRRKAQQHADAQEFTHDDVRRLMSSLTDQLLEGIQSGHAKTIKVELGKLIEGITLDPVSEECTIHYRIAPADTGVIVASPRGFEPLYSP